MIRNLLATWYSHPMVPSYQIFKRGGLAGPQFLEGVLEGVDEKEGSDLFEGGLQFHIKNN